MNDKTSWARHVRRKGGVSLFVYYTQRKFRESPTGMLHKNIELGDT